MHEVEIREAARSVIDSGWYLQEFKSFRYKLGSSSIRIPHLN